MSGANGNGGNGSANGTSKPHRSTATERPCILVVDDDDLVRIAVARCLRSWFHVLDASGVASAVEQLEKGTVDAVITDVTLRGESGVDLHAIIAKRFPGLTRRTAFITGGVVSESTRAFLASGHHVLQKPVKVEDLRAVVKLMLDASKLES